MTRQLSIFDAETASLCQWPHDATPPESCRQREAWLAELHRSSGLVFCEGFLTPEEESLCIERIDAAEGLWLNDLSRRVQHYGWRYDYKARAITP